MRLRRDEVLAILRDLEQSLRAQGLAHIYLFGSIAPDTQTEFSDIDLAFDVAPSANERFSLIDQSRIQRQLSAALGTQVDFVERDYLRPRIAGSAKRDLIQVF